MHTKDRKLLFQELFESAPDAIFIEDKEGRILECNLAAAALHGTPREKLIGKNAAELVPPEYRSRLVTMQSNGPREFAGFSLTADGRSIPVSIRLNPIDYFGQPAVALHVRDITEANRFVEELQRTNDALEFRVQSRTAELQRANEVLREEIAERNRAEDARKRLEIEVQGAYKMEAVGRLAGGVAHDFNNLLTVIIVRCETLLGRLSDTDPMRSELSVMNEAAQRAAKVTRQLLAFGRKQVLQVKVLDVNAVISNMETMVQSLTGEKVELINDLNDELWHVEADPGQIEQVLMNLVVNAVDAMPDGGKLRIHSSNVELEESPPGFGFNVKSGPYAMFSVQDSGIGMSPDVMKRIFEPFFTTKDKTGGSGLGLPTVYGIVKQSGGYITVQSKPGEGSTFKVFLPGLLGTTAHSESAEDHIQTTTTTVLIGSETILLAEDSPLVRQLTRELLEVRGYTVLEASNGEEALTICKGHSGPIHLTLSDVVMPGMTGRELAKHVVQVRPQIKVLLMSGYTDEITKSDFMHAGLNFIEKPFTSNSLASKVREVLDVPTTSNEGAPSA